MKPIKALIVDDSAIIRRILVGLLETDPTIDVVATAANGKIGLRKISKYKPDVIVLDIEMPEMNGIEMLHELRKTDHNTTVIMFSTLTECGADATLDALHAGADDYETKPHSLGNTEELKENIEAGLIRKIRQLRGHKRKKEALDLPHSPVRETVHPSKIKSQTEKKAEAVTTKSKTYSNSRRAKHSTDVFPLTSAAKKTNRIDVLVLGISTGGPAALKTIIPLIPGDFPVPILIVQHMPPVFTKRMAERLNSLSPLNVQEAYDGATIRAGDVWIAPGDYHMEVVESKGFHTLRTQQEEKENFSRPSVDVLFRSAAKTYGKHVLAAILTGMGEDGLVGCQLIGQRGGQVLTQDKDSSVVWGMPGAVTNAGLSDKVVPLEDFPFEFSQRTKQKTLPIPAIKLES